MAPGWEGVVRGRFWMEEGRGDGNDVFAEFELIIICSQSGRRQNSKYRLPLPLQTPMAAMMKLTHDKHAHTESTRTSSSLVTLIIVIN